MPIEGSSPPSEDEPDSPDPEEYTGYKKLFMIFIVITVVVVFMAEMASGGRNRTPRGTSTPTATSTPTPIPTATPTFSKGTARAEEMSYKTLFRYAEDNTGKLVYYEGNVVQVIEGQGGVRLRVNVTPEGFGFWTDTVFLRYADPPVRVLEDDLIEFVGRMNGLVTYESVTGAQITIPDLTVLSLKITSE